MPETIFTVGHSTRSAAELIDLLRDAGVAALADVRRFPASRHNPQFSRAALAESLRGAGVDYVWLGEALGGRRSQLVPVEQSANRAWQVAAFRHYADAMQTDEFRAGIEELEAVARTRPTAIMCAEHNWWSCHRRLLADFLVVRGWPVVHLLDPGKRQDHVLTEWARISDGVLTYPGLI